MRQVKQMATDVKTTPTKLQKALDFKAKYEALITEAKDEALAQIKEAVDSLKDLGLTYHVLSEEEYNKLTSAPTAVKRGRPAGSTNAPKKADNPSAKYDSAKKCDKCHIIGHLNKSHNLAEGFKDKAFTEEELKKRGYWPPDGQLVKA